MEIVRWGLGEILVFEKVAQLLRVHLKTHQSSRSGLEDVLTKHCMLSRSSDRRRCTISKNCHQNKNNTIHDCYVMLFSEPLNTDWHLGVKISHILTSRSHLTISPGEQSKTDKQEPRPSYGSMVQCIAINVMLCWSYDAKSTEQQR